MPTKHIDDATAAQLDDLYVRCVTLTQQPVKEVEVLRLAIQNGIGNITDNDILSIMTVKDMVWQKLADQVWSEVIAWWPEDAINTARFEALATEHSVTWQQFSSEICRTAICGRLKPQLQEFIPYGLFEKDDFSMTDEEIRAAVERDAELDIKYKEQLRGLHGRLYSSLNDHEKDLTNCYSDKVGFVPGGKGDFELQVTDPHTKD